MMAIRVSSSTSHLRRPLKSCSSNSSSSSRVTTNTTGSSNVLIAYLVLLLVALPVNGMSTQQRQQQQQPGKYGQNSAAAVAAAEQSLAEQMILAEPPQLQVGKPSPYDLELGGNDILLSPDQSAIDQAAAADRAKLLSKIMTLVLEGKRLPPHIVGKFSPRTLSLLSAASSSYSSSPSSSSSSGLQHKRQIRYQQCYFNPISCFK